MASADRAAHFLRQIVMSFYLLVAIQLVRARSILKLDRQTEPYIDLSQSEEVQIQAKTSAVKRYNAVESDGNVEKPMTSSVNIP
jgi:hypothetical protein